MYLLDTNICIYIIKNRPDSVLKELRQKSRKDIFISSITVAELQYGVEKSSFIERNKIALIGFLSRFSIIDFNDMDAVAFGWIKAGLEKAGNIIGPMDLLISAQAVSRNLILVTNNRGEFDRINGLRVENWAR
jgi:tRNA(fMet)-specific endonuclease VapC